MLKLFSVTMLLQKYLHHYSETILYIYILYKTANNYVNVIRIQVFHDIHF